MDLQNKELLVRYFLGDLPNEEASTVEEQYFTNDEVWSALDAVEEELIEAYLTDRLPPQDKKRFENFYLASTRNRQRVEITKALIAQASKEASRGVAHQRRRFPWPGFLGGWFGGRLAPWVPLGMAVAIALIAAGSAVWTARANQQLRGRLAHMETEQSELRRHEQELNSRLEKTTGQVQQKTSTPGNPIEQAAESQPLGASMLVLSLAAGNFRSMNGRPATLSIATGMSTVLLLLNQPPDRNGSYDYVSYDASIETAEGQNLLRKRNLKPQYASTLRKVIAVELPSRIFKSGDYSLILSGHRGAETEDLATYVFHVDEIR